MGIFGVIMGAISFSGDVVTFSSNEITFGGAASGLLKKIFGELKPALFGVLN